MVGLYVPIVLLGFALFLWLVLRWRSNTQRQIDDGQGVSVENPPD